MVETSEVCPSGERLVYYYLSGGTKAVPTYEIGHCS